MAYHKPVYLFLFLPLFLVAYQVAPKRMRKWVLLIASYVFFWTISGKLVLYLMGTTLIIHYVGIWIGWMKEQGNKETKGKQKMVLAGGVLLLLGTLGYLKYYNFFAENVNLLLRMLKLDTSLQAKEILLPIGISFYTLQAIGYMADVYWGKIKPEQNLGKLALFLAFFPQIMEGPISTYSQTADALWACESLKARNLSRGFARILWGMFKKIVIADRLYVLVQTVFDNYENYGGVVVAAAAVAYTAQLYMEFSGCIDIVIGSGDLFGITLPENFRQPFASRNAAEFWRRWHITLGAWFKAYVFYPVSVSRLSKKWNKFGKKHLSRHATKVGASAIALFPVWLGNGLWHGSQWSYIFFGMYYFVILMAGIMVEPVRLSILNAMHLDEDAWYYRGVQIFKTWIIIVTGELFFRANGLRAGIQMFFSVFRDFTPEQLWNGDMLSLGLDRADYAVVFAGCLVVFLVGVLKERSMLDADRLMEWRTPARWAVYYGLILAVVILGAYGVGYQQVDLIYAGF